MNQDDDDTKRIEALSAHKVPHFDDVVYEAGKPLGGRYEVISLLGRGGMGLVYRVKQLYLNREFALKIIDKRHLSEIALRRFQHEARTTFSLDHPNIVKIHDFGTLEDDTPFLVMELINGETLSDYLKKHGALSVNDAISLFVQICFGLAHAHECGVIHRDIKPGNLMLIKSLPFDTEGSIKILDFGIAKFASLEQGEIQALTRTGEIFGSPIYMSPEQCSGAKVDQRSDIYSLGCVLFESLTGAPPFIGENALQTMMKHQSEEIVSLREAALGKEFPPALESIVASMVAKSPSQRYSDLGKVAFDLGAVKRGESLSKNREVSNSSEAKISMTPATFWGIILAAILISGTLSWIVSSSQRNTKGGSEPTTRAPEPQSAEEMLRSEYRVYPLSLPDLQKRLDYHLSPTDFSLQRFKITRQVLSSIARHTWIKSLLFRGCEIDNSALSELEPLPLERLDFSDSDFNDDGVDVLSKRKHRIPEFIVNRTILTEAGITQLVSSENLRYLSIAGMPVTDENIRVICKINHLVHLDLQNDRLISPRGFDDICKLKMQSLGLERTNVDHKALLHIATINSLEQIVLDGTSATFDDVLRFCRLPKMQAINIKDCPNLTTAQRAKLRSQYPKLNFQ